MDQEKGTKGSPRDSLNRPRNLQHLYGIRVECLLRDPLILDSLTTAEEEEKETKESSTGTQLQNPYSADDRRSSRG